MRLFYLERGMGFFFFGNVGGYIYKYTDRQYIVLCTSFFYMTQKRFFISGKACMRHLRYAKIHKVITSHIFQMKTISFLFFNFEEWKYDAWDRFFFSLTHFQNGRWKKQFSPILFWAVEAFKALRYQKGRLRLWLKERPPFFLWWIGKYSGDCWTHVPNWTEQIKPLKLVQLLKDICDKWGLNGHDKEAWIMKGIGPQMCISSWSIW